MRGKRNFVDYRLDHAWSVFSIVIVFALLIAVVILATLYTAGVLRPSGLLVSPFSIGSALCNSSGVFVSLQNNVDQQVSVSSVQLGGVSQTVLFTPAGTGTTPFDIPAGGAVELHSAGYLCPVFNTLPSVQLSIAFNSSVMTTYTFGNNYWYTLLANKGNVSETIS